MDIPFDYHRFIIGNKGANVRRLMDDYNVNIAIPPAKDKSDVVNIVGPKTNVAKAIEALKEKVIEIEAENEDRVSLPFLSFSFLLRLLSFLTFPFFLFFSFLSIPSFRFFLSLSLSHPFFHSFCLSVFLSSFPFFSFSPFILSRCFHFLVSSHKAVLQQISNRYVIIIHHRKYNSEGSSGIGF